MAAKRPTGELPKRISKEAKKIKDYPLGMTGNQYNTLSPSAAAGYAGKMRDQSKKKATAGNTGAGKAVTVKKSAPSTISQITKRFGITAREARDIATAVGSAATAIRKSPQEGMPVKKIVKDIAKQVKETGTAAAKGKKGTSAYQVKPKVASQKARGAAGDKGFVTYKVKGSKTR